MAKSSTRSRNRPRPPTRGGARRRPPARRPPAPRGWLARYWYWAVVAVVAVIVVAVMAFSAGDNGTDEGGVGGLTGADFHSLVVDPADPQRVFVGGHQSVSVSTDGGATWTEIGSLRDADAMGWAFTREAVYVSGHPGLNQSTDSGGRFKRVNEGLPDTDLHALGGSDQVLYAAGPSVGVIAATGGPGDWDQRTDQAGQSFFGRIVVDPAADDHLFAADAAAGVAESTDGGRTWQLLDSGLPAAAWLSRGGDGLEEVVASGPNGVARSPDGGRTWQALDVPDGASLVEAVPGQPNLLYAGVHNGSRVQVHVSRDGGDTWTTP